MKFGQLIKYNLRNIFLEKSHTKCGRKTIPRPFFKKLKSRLSLDQYSKASYIYIYIYVYKNKKRSGTSPLLHFPHGF